MNNNFFKIGILTCLVLISFSVFYYFVIHLPNLNNTKRELEKVKDEEQALEKEKQLNSDCAKDGRTFINNIETSPDQSMSEPEFFYNKELNTCLVSYTVVDVGAGRHWVNLYIQDVYTNKTLADSYTELIENHEKRTKDRVHRLGLTEDQWTAEYNRLMK